MLAVGFPHGEWLPQVPTIGYRPAVVVVYLLSMVASAVRPSSYAIQTLMKDD